MRGTLVSALAVLCLIAVALPAPSVAQTNNDDYTPLNSRIKRDRQFPLDLPPRFVPAEKMGKVELDRGQTMVSKLGKCLYRRSIPVALDLLDKTDLGFITFDQIKLPLDRALRIYGFSDCLDRVSQATNSNWAIRFTPGSLREWLIQAAYFDRYPKGPDWLKPGYVIAERQYPLSGGDRNIQMALDFADCIVSTDPNNADYFYRTVANSPDEGEALKTLTPSLGPCLPQGMQLQLTPETLRLWLGEALWQAANHSGPSPAQDTPGKR